MSRRFASSATLFSGSIRFLRNFSSLLRRFLRRLAYSRSGYVPELPTFRRELATSCTGVASTGCTIATFAICDAVHDGRGRLHYLRVTKEELENVALESTRTIEIDEFVAGDEIDPPPYHPPLLPASGRQGRARRLRRDPRDNPREKQVCDGTGVADQPQAHHRARATRQGPHGHAAALPLRSAVRGRVFDEIQDVKVTKDMLDLAKHIVDQKSGRFEPEKFEDQYKAALVELINSKRSGKPITAKARPRGDNVVDLMEALRRSVGGAEPAKGLKASKKPRKASGQKEMLMPIDGKKAKQTPAKKSASKPQRKSA